MFVKLKSVVMVMLLSLMTSLRITGGDDVKIVMHFLALLIWEVLASVWVSVMVVEMLVD